MTNNNAPPPIELEDLVSAIKSQMDNLNEEQPKRILHLPLTEANYPKIINSLIIGDEDSYPEQPSLLDRLEANDKLAKMILKDGICTIAAKAKFGKSKLAYFLLSAILALNVFNEIFYACMDAFQNQIVVFDTEQTHFSCWKSKQIIKKLLEDKSKMNRLFFVSLRRFNHLERISIITRFISEHPQIGMVIIDGVRDLVMDPNSGEEANKIISLFLKLSAEKNLSILTVIHQNKSDNNMRGHLGTELMNKSETVITIEQQDDLFIAKPMATRNEPFTPFAFRIGEDGVPYLVKDFAIKASKRSKVANTVDPNKIAEEIHREALIAVMSLYTTSLPGWGDLVKALVAFFDEKSIKIGGNKIREFVAHYLAKGWLVKQPVAGRSYSGYQYMPSADM